MNDTVHPVNDLRALIGFAILALLFLGTLPFMAVKYVINEGVRYERCATRSAKDLTCARGMLWNVFDKLNTMRDDATERVGSTASTSTLSQLGSEGGACGGPHRLPCLPGLSCRQTEEGGFGTCVKVSAVDISAPTHQENQGCGFTIGVCDAGLVCKVSPGTTSGVCITADANAPQLLSLKLQGMSYDTDTYVAEAGAKVEITTQAVNADTVSVYLAANTDASPNLAHELLTKLTKGKGGAFTGEFTVPSGLNGRLEVQAFDTHGQVAALSVKVAAK